MSIVNSTYKVVVHKFPVNKQCCQQKEFIHMHAQKQNMQFSKFINYVNFTEIVFAHKFPVNKQMKL